MNKQEFQQKIKDMRPPKFFTAISLGEAFEAGFKEARVNVLLASDFLDEPEKPVVPQFVADYIDSERNSCSTFSEALSNMYYEQKIIDWFYINSETFAKAWLYGYEIEKEKLYTVEIPSHGNPNHFVLHKHVDGEVCIDYYLSDNWRDYKCAQLTEAEIKKDHDWAWKYAEEV